PRRRDRQMRRREFIGCMVGSAALRSVASLAQQPKVPVIGMLFAGNVPEFQIRVFWQGLRELGYIEGQNIRQEIRSAEGDPLRLPEMAAVLVREQVDVIVPFNS